MNLRVSDEFFFSEKKYQVIFFWVPIATLFLITNIAQDTLAVLLVQPFIYFQPFIPSQFASLTPERFIEKIILPTEETLFFYSFIMLVFAFIKSLNPSVFGKGMFDRCFKWQYVFIMMILSVLVSNILVKSMGAGYLQISVDPFNQMTNWYYRRLLVPALAYFTHLNGIFYHIFFYFLVYVLIAYSVRVLSIKSTWQLVSIFSSGFVVYQFQFPGYVEVLVGVLFLIAFTQELSRYQRAILLSLALITHESAAIFMFAPLLFLVDSWKDRFFYASIVLLYVFTVLMNFSFDINNLVSLQTSVGATSSFDYLKQNLDYGAYGIFFSYKVLWVFYFWYLFLNVSAKEKAFVSCVVLLPLLQIFIAVDISRLVAFGFLGIFLAIKAVFESSQKKQLINALLILNLVVPSYYVGTNTGVLEFNGLYKVYSYIINE